MSTAPVRAKRNATHGRAALESAHTQVSAFDFMPVAGAAPAEPVGVATSAPGLATSAPGLAASAAAASPQPQPQPPGSVPGAATETTDYRRAPGPPASAGSATAAAEAEASAAKLGTLAAVVEARARVCARACAGATRGAATRRAALRLQPVKRKKKQTARFGRADDDDEPTPNPLPPPATPPPAGTHECRCAPRADAVTGLGFLLAHRRTARVPRERRVSNA